jgi:serine phosphatase RsbU (regulator of sigma subunit)
MPANLPFPIAYSYHLIDTTARTGPEARYRALLQCYEAVVRYCAAVQLSDYLAAGCPDSAINRLLLDRLGRNIGVGHWVELTREITARQRDGRFPAFMPEVATFYFKPDRGRGLTPEGEIFDSVLCAARNDAAHPDHVWTTTTCEHKFNEHKPLLDRLLQALHFLERYPLYVPYQWRRGDVVHQAIVLMGPLVPLRVKSDLNLALSPRLRADLEDETTAFLVAPDDPARQLLLYPLSVFHRRGDSEDIFLFENCELGRKGIKWLLYRAFSLGQGPLEITPGEEHARLVDHFRAVLQALGGASGPAEGRGDDLSAHYFSAQRRVLRDGAHTFVGREYVGAALDRFVGAHRRGYFLVRGGPGQGKTAVACHLIRQRQLVHHLVHPTGGRDDTRLILRSLLAQLLPLSGRPAVLPETVPELTKLLEDVLGRVAAGRPGLVVVIDGLDELPADAGDPPPFFVTDGLPEGVYYVVTSRPGERLDRLRDRLPRAEREVYDLGALELSEMAAVLDVRRPDLSAADVERIAEASQGNPQYLLAVADELARDPHFDLRGLPPDIEGFFRGATAHLRRGDASLGRDVLGLLSVARKPLTPRELSQVTGQPMRLVHEQGLRPVRQFLYEADDGCSFYHARFRDFVARELLYEDELPHYHGRLAAWLSRPEAAAYDYHSTSLAYHLFESGDHAGLLRAVDEDFLRRKVRRFGYAVLEDVELLTRALMEANDPALVSRCVALVEGLRAEAGGDIIENIRQAVRPYQPGPASFRSRVLAPPVPSVPGLDVWVGMLPKVEVGADFFEVIPQGDRLVLVLGDAPGAGLKPAFVARFLGNACRRLVEREGLRDLGELLGRVNALVSGHDYFETVAMQCVEIDVRAGLLTLANAGVPAPALYSARWQTCDVLPVRGGLLHAAADPGDIPRWQQRRAEVGPGDVLVLVTDGLTEGNRLRPGGYGYRFKELVKARAGQGARAVGEAVLDDWRAYPREGDYADDVTVVVATVTGDRPR